MTSSVHPELEYAAFLADGRFMLQRSASTGQYVFFPRIVQPGTGLDDLRWTEASGEGQVYSFTVTRNKPPAADFVIALIDLAEGVRMMSRLVDIDPANVRIGMAVRAHVGAVDGTPAVLFSPVKEEKA